MEKFIFSISEIFDKSDKDKSDETNYNCLEKNNVKRYFIGPYQRGYKWKSDTILDHIPVLLLDLYDAFLKSKEKQGLKDYYLQYITVKKTKEEINKTQEEVFEVIDGQQRLTSLTLMFNILNIYFNEYNLTKDANGDYLVAYSRYNNNNIFDEIIDMIKDKTLNEKEIIEQDKYYMFKASKCFKDFFDLMQEEKDFDDFLEFIKANVKIILNKEDDFTSAEQVFANLNANKVALTNAYLIKGLLLTKATRRNVNGYSKKHFKEIMDERAIMGRLWDEIYSWFNQKDVSTFFFATKENGMEKLLELVYDIYYTNDNTENEIIKKFENNFKVKELSHIINNDYELFNRFHNSIRTEEKAFVCLNQIKHTYKLLRSWYEQPEFYNLIGYNQFTIKYKDVKEKQKRFYGNIRNLMNKSNIELLKQLKDNVIKAILIKQGESLGYENKNKTHQLLLALSVFPEHEDNTKEKRFRFDFYSFSEENWTLEHIFPQNPNTEKITIESEIDREWVRKKIEERINKKDTTTVEKQKLNDTINKVINGEEINSSDIGFIFSEVVNPHDLGNMALLSIRVNPALSNSFFNGKRVKILKKINEGNFVPKHTIDLFSKMLSPLKIEENNLIIDKKLDSTLTTWTNTDIDFHKHWILNRLQEIIKLLN